MRKPAFCICENKDADQLRSYALIIAFVFAIRIVQSLFYLNPKFQASSHLLWLYRPVCVGPGRKPRRPVLILTTRLLCRDGPTYPLFLGRLSQDFQAVNHYSSQFAALRVDLCIPAHQFLQAPMDGNLSVSSITLSILRKMVKTSTIREVVIVFTF